MHRLRPEDIPESVQCQHCGADTETEVVETKPTVH